MYGHGPCRSAVVSEKIEFPLQETWTYQALQPPAPAWPQPGKELHRIDFDYAFQPVIADGLVYFGSSADDTVRALDVATGKAIWRFTTGGPVRFAPVVARGKVYIASDDGRLYCVTVAAGELVWQVRGGPNERQLLGNGRMISRWPLRSGALVVGNVVYFAAGMWPTQGVYVYALDADTGEKVWCNDSSGNRFINLPHCGSPGFSGVAPQGYLLASGNKLLVPTGRSVPAAFDRHTGRLLYYNPDESTKEGGTRIAVVGDLYFHRKQNSQLGTQSHIGEVKPGRHVLNAMFAYSLASGKRDPMWLGYEFVSDGNTTYTIYSESVVAVDHQAWRAEKVKSKAAFRECIRWNVPHTSEPGAAVYSMALTGNALFVGHADSVTAFDISDGKQIWKAPVNGQARGMAVAAGSLVVATDKGTLTCFARIKAGGEPAARVKRDLTTAAVVSEPYRVRAADIVRETGVSKGYALLVGEPHCRLAAALADATDLHIVSLLREGSQLRAERERLVEAGLYGSRVVVQGRDDLSRLPYAPYFADLVVVSGSVDGLSGDELYRVLRPCGGVLYFSDLKSPRVQKFMRSSNIPPREIAKDGRKIVRGVLPGAGQWRYQWADGGCTGIGNESRVQLPLELLWFGGLGPDRVMDRHKSAAAPLSLNGRVFVTGQHHFICYDAYTGRELWCRQMQNVARLGPRYFSANLVADDTSLYAVIGDVCHRLDQVTGKTVMTYTIPEQLTREMDAVIAEETDWGYVSVSGNILLGSYRLPAEGFGRKWWLNEQDHSKAGPWWVIPRYSNALFALDKNSKSLLWHYRARHTVNGTYIAFGDDRIFLVDATPHDVVEKAKRVGEKIEVKRSLVALSLADGSELWRSDDLGHLPELYHRLQYARGVVVVGGKEGYDAGTGERLWQNMNTTADKVPVIHGDRIITFRHAYDLRTGKELKAADILTGQQAPWQFMRSRGCGLIAGIQDLLFFRAGVLGFFDLKTDGLTNFGGVRPGCAINVVAANGLINMPESSSGCVCSYNFQTSLALVPGSDRNDLWYRFPSLANAGPIEQMRINLGAPGDRRDTEGLAWIGFPQIGIRSRTPVLLPVTVLMEKPSWHYSPAATRVIKNTGRPWIYSSGLSGQGKLAIDLEQRTKSIVVPNCDEPPAIDGAIADACWREAKRIPFAGDADLLEPYTTLFARRDTNNLYFACRRKAAMRDGKPLPFVADHTGDNAECGKDDYFEIVITDRRQPWCPGAHFAVSCAGGRFEGLSHISSEGPLDLKWHGEWNYAVKKTPYEWTAEIAIPLETLRKEKLDPRRLYLNCMSQNLSGHGLKRIFLVNSDIQFYRCRSFARVLDKPTVESVPRERSFTVRLHFAEEDNIDVGDRVFDVVLQDKPVLKDFDVLEEAGGRNVALVKEFKGVTATDVITLELVSGNEGDAAGRPPVIDGIEIVEDDSE